MPIYYQYKRGTQDRRRTIREVAERGGRDPGTFAKVMLPAMATHDAAATPALRLHWDEHSSSSLTFYASFYPSSKLGQQFSYLGELHGGEEGRRSCIYIVPLVNTSQPKTILFLHGPDIFSQTFIPPFKPSTVFQFHPQSPNSSGGKGGSLSMKYACC